MPKRQLNDVWRKGLLLAIAALLLLAAWRYRDAITVETLLTYRPKNMWLAAVFMLVLFTGKLFLVGLYGGILYAASGVMFPLPLALVVNALGTVCMTTFPFILGERYGAQSLERALDKHPKLRLLETLTDGNHFFVTLMLRLMGCLPADWVGMYLGASRFQYKAYISATLLGLLPSMVNFTVMGMSAHDPHSPAFRISVLIELSLLLISLLMYRAWRRKDKKDEVAQ